MIEKIEELRKLFERLKNTSGSTGKVAILRSNSDNELFKTTLQFVYDDFVRTGMSYKTLSQPITTHITGYEGEYTLEGMMSYVKDHNTGTLSTVAFVQDFCSLFSEETRDFLYHVFANDLKVGITANTINKALRDGFIKQFNVQLAHPYHKHPEKVAGKEFVLTQKLDGHRCICIVNGEEVTFYTRKGLVINGLAGQGAEASNLVHQGMGVNSYVLDGELLLDNPDDLETKDLFRATSRVLRSEDADKSNILYNVFDALPLSEFFSGKSSKTFVERKSGLVEAFEQASMQEGFHIRLVQNLYQGTDLGAIHRLQKELVEPLGWEGLMINLADGKYECKRTTNLLKVKEFFDADVVVKDVFEGTGRLEHTLGGVIVDYKGYEVRVGSGFSQAERDNFWEHQEELIGKVIQISYFEETHNQNDDGISLRFPTYVCRRFEKTPADVSYEV